MNEEDKPTPSDDKLVWFLVAFIILIAIMRSCV
jgi:hypothetical protein